ncbi:hypothetical protein J4429_05445 [Candidatus Pacearchaeota archaeon]|nr:hypothetical protein [Candidatus Pacearchaeota archaeon]
MKKKKKPIITKLDEDCSDSELVKLLKESHSYPTANNGSSNNVINEGFYLKYKGIYFFNRIYGNDGLEEEDIRKIAGQLEKVCKKCAYMVNEDYILVKSNGEKFYVHVDDIGIVWLPELVGSDADSTRSQKVYGKTNDYKKVLGLVKRAQK